ncbi:MAG: hypothetical protein ACLR73_09300 [Bifidobacterium pseudocatenulatum]
MMKEKNSSFVRNEWMFRTSVTVQIELMTEVNSAELPLGLVLAKGLGVRTPPGARDSEGFMPLSGM